MSYTWRIACTLLGVHRAARSLALGSFVIALAAPRAAEARPPMKPAVEAGWLTEKGELTEVAQRAARSLSVDANMKLLEQRLTEVDPDKLVIASAADLDRGLGHTGDFRKKMSRLDALVFMMTGGRVAGQPPPPNAPPVPDVVKLDGDVFPIDREEEFVEAVRDIGIARTRAQELTGKEPVVLWQCGNHELHAPGAGTREWNATPRGVPDLVRRAGKAIGIAAVNVVSPARRAPQSLYDAYIAPSADAPYPHSADGDFLFFTGKNRENLHVMMNSSRPGHDSGKLTDAQSEWLRGVATKWFPRVTAVDIDMHHSPMPDSEADSKPRVSDRSFRQTSHFVEGREKFWSTLLPFAKAKGAPEIIIHAGHAHGYSERVIHVGDHPVRVIVGPALASPTFELNTHFVQEHGYRLTVGANESYVLLNATPERGEAGALWMTGDEARRTLFGSSETRRLSFGTGAGAEELSVEVNVPDQKVMPIERHPTVLAQVERRAWSLGGALGIDRLRARAQQWRDNPRADLWRADGPHAITVDVRWRPQTSAPASTRARAPGSPAPAGATPSSPSSPASPRVPGGAAALRLRTR